MRKTYAVKQRGDGWVTVSTADLDRDGDIVEPLGLDLTNWQRAGSPLFWGHDYSAASSIIGRASAARVTPAGLEIKPDWRPPVNDLDPMTVIGDLWNRGLARSFSIGFLPREAEPLPGGGKRFLSAEILEVSLVGVPANPYATANGLSVKSITRRLRKHREAVLWCEVMTLLLEVYQEEKEKERRRQWAF